MVVVVVVVVVGELGVRSPTLVLPTFNSLEAPDPESIRLNSRGAFVHKHSWTVTKHS